MLAFVDRAKVIRVVRITTDRTGKPQRERLGLIQKGDFVIPPELTQAINAEEQKQVEETVDLYKRAAQVGRQARALNFPGYMREVTDYVLASASESEKKFVVFAVLEAIRVIRKSESIGDRLA